jgi:sucrose-phosphate synthase
MMHIAFLNPQGNFDPADRYWTAHPDFGGQLVYVKEVALALGALGNRADILTRRIVDAEWKGFEGQEDRYADSPNVRIIRLDCGPPGFLRKELLWPHLYEWMEKILGHYRQEETTPEVWTGHYADGGLAAALLAEATGRAFTFTGHSLGAQKLERLLESSDAVAALDREYHFGARLTAERTAMSRAGRIIVSTEEERRRQYGHRWYAGAVDPADGSRYAVIPPGVNLRLFDQASTNHKEGTTAAKVDAVLSRDLAPERLSLPCILASARLEPKKNHVGLVRAYVSSDQLQAQANLVLAVRGLPGPLRETRLESTDLPAEAKTILSEIYFLVEAHALWGKVATISLEGQDELAAGYRHLSRRRSVFCLPAHHEPFGLAPLEAMAAGLPVVSTRFGGPSESMADGQVEYGVLADPNDPSEFAGGLLRLVADPAEWAQFQEAGHQRVLDRYTWERTAEGYAAVCATLRSEPRRTDGFPIPRCFTHPDQENEPRLSGLLS